MPANDNENYVKRASASSNLHAGHRERMRQRFLDNGIDNFQEHEILEFLLFYVHSRANTNEIGHRLIEEFGSLRRVLDANYEELLEVKGVGERGAVLLKFLPQLLRAYGSSEVLGTSLQEFRVRRDFFKDLLNGETDEVVMFACLDDAYRLVRYSEIGRGEPDRVRLNAQKMMKVALLSKCTNFIVAHNHPKGVAMPSPEDIETTYQIAVMFENIGLNLTDHIIVANGRSCSMKESRGTLKSLY